MTDFAATYGDEVRALAEELVRFDTTGGNERPAQAFLRERLADLGFETYTWTPDPEALATLSSFPPVDDLDPAVADRPSVAGVLELGDPDRGPTLVLNGHVDVVPAASGEWSGDPFEPRWVADSPDSNANHEGGDRLVGRGAVDMKSQVAACVYAARHLADGSEGSEERLDGRIVVESVAGEEEGGYGAAAAALSNPYPFERDAAVVTEPTDMRVVTATEGCLMCRIDIEGRPAHAARRWEGDSVLPKFERVRERLRDLERERGERVTHPLYERFEVPWPVVVGRVDAGTWASNVPGTLTAECRVGVAPGESLDAVEREVRAALADLADDEAWTGPAPTVERFGVQFESAEVDADEAVVRALRDALASVDERTTGGDGQFETEPTGETYGSDARHYVRAGVPAVVFGPGRIEAAHFPDESVRWSAVLTAGEALVGAAERFLADSSAE